MCLKDRRLLLRVAKLPRVKTVPVYIPVTVGRGLSPTFLCVLVLLVHFEMGWHCIATAVPVQSALQVPKKAWGKTMRNMSGCYLRSPVRQLRLKKIWLSWVDKTYDKWQTVEMPGEQQFQ